MHQNQAKTLKLAIVAGTLLVMGAIATLPEAESRQEAKYPRVLLTTAPAGYQVWQQSDACIAITGLKSEHFAAIGGDVGGFKAAMRRRYGVRCVVVNNIFGE